MISPAALKKYGNKDIAFNPVGTGPFKFVEWKATDYLKVAKFDGYWKKGYPKVDTHHLEAGRRQQLARGGDADGRGAVHLSGAATEMAEVLKAKPELDVVAAPSIIAALPVDEHAAEAVRQPEGAPGDQLRDQQGRRGEGGVQRLRDAGGRRRARRASSTRSRSASWPYDVAKAKTAAGRGRLSRTASRPSCGRRTTTRRRRR